jgi:hypothetical protein
MRDAPVPAPAVLKARKENSLAHVHRTSAVSSQGQQQNPRSMVPKTVFSAVGRVIFQKVF